VGFNSESELVEPHYIGEMNKLCQFCQSLNFKPEANKNKYSLCCQKGLISLNGLNIVPDFIKDLYNGVSKHSKNFLDNIRNYNSALAFASMAATFDPKMRKKGPYFFKISGQVYHYTSSTLYPTNNDCPRYSQLYILDTKDATANRMNIAENKCCEPEVIYLMVSLKFNL
jgi:hypothetical protein